MARDYGRVKTKFWDNEDIKGCSPAAKMMALYLLTSQHSNAIGLYRLPVAYMQDDTGLTKDEIIQAFSELRAIGFVAWCERMPWIWIRHYLKHNKPENPNVWRKCVKELQSVPGECLESVESVAADLSQIAREPRMMREHGGISADEITVLKQYRNRIETVVPDKNNHGAGLMPLSLSLSLPTPEPEPIPEPEPKSISAKQASPVADAPLPDFPIPEIPPLAKTKPHRLNGSSVDFQAFYDAFPLHKSRRAAEKAYISALKRATPEQILIGARQYSLDVRRKPEFTKHPASWLNADGWLDEAPEQKKSAIDVLYDQLKEAENGAGN